ncbi:protein NKG7-like isoform X2 [Talpa occidentalis]|uniref:protein NKG7-like isoform X2 n=1 Tax=Talpa occidentalis TaxID=50954 RepID=UPI00188FD396|nr:protein NKG7-like isoform X2 [Talpa occidentalis]
MEPCRTLAVLAGCLGLVFILVAVSTDFWIMDTGPRFSAHLGLWPRSRRDPVKSYIHVTRIFAILSALLGLVSVGFLVLSCIPSWSAPVRGPLVSCITGFAAVAMAVYTIEWWSRIPSTPAPSYFSWSYYLGCMSVAFLGITGAPSLPMRGRERKASLTLVELPQK